MLIILPLLSFKCFAASPIDELYKQFNVDDLLNAVPDESTTIYEELFSSEIKIEKYI